jgi:hypothetical protein
LLRRAEGHGKIRNAGKARLAQFVRSKFGLASV